MRQHFHLFPLTIGLISFLYLGFATQHGAFGAGDQSRLMSLDEYKEALPATAEELDLAGFLALQKSAEVTVLDVRDDKSFARRHLGGSVNAPLTGLTEKNLPALAPDKTKPVVLVCDYSFFPTRMIAMTLQAYPVLKANGYSRIYRLNLWQNKKGGEMITPEAQEKALSFEGSDVK